MDLRSAINKVNKRGMLLVYPINNRPEPPSLWSEFYPRSEMRWEWDDGADGRVANLWHMRERLSTSGKVVYTKWFRGRATLLSLDLYRALARLLVPGDPDRGLSLQSRDVLDILREDSPLSTKALKRAAGLQGRDLEKPYVAALKELWSRLLIVGFGEVDEGAFPSLAIGAAQVLFENEWNESRRLKVDEARACLERYFPTGSAFRKFFDQVYLRAADPSALMR